MKHQMAVKYWKQTGTYQARCSCKWAAEWPHTNRSAALADGVAHVRAELLRASDEHWIPGV